jgi:hypothetical protein
MSGIPIGSSIPIGSGETGGFWSVSLNKSLHSGPRKAYAAIRAAISALFSARQQRVAQQQALTQ